MTPQVESKCHGQPWTLVGLGLSGQGVWFDPRCCEHRTATASSSMAMSWVQGTVQRLQRVSPWCRCQLDTVIPGTYVQARRCKAMTWAQAQDAGAAAMSGIA